VVVTTATSLGDGGLEPGSVLMYYRIDGGEFVAATLAATGNPDEYAGDIPTQPWGSVVEYYLSAENDEGDPGTHPIGAPAHSHYFRVDDDFSDGFETDSAWRLSLLGNDAMTGLWTRIDPVGTVYNGHTVQTEDDHTAAPGNHCFVTANGFVGGTGGAHDVDRGQTTLLSPVYDLTGGNNVAISYWRWYTNDLGYNPGEDIWAVDISNDGGQTWAAVEQTTASNNAWQEVDFDLADYFPTPGLVQLRFIAEDIGNGSLVEAAVDDFSLTGDFGGATAVGDDVPTQRALDLRQNAPNPFNPRTEIHFSLDRAGPATLTLFDTRGRLIAVLVSGQLARGEHRVVWDGTDQTGRPMTSGVYFYVLEAAGGRVARQMVLLR
jgi:hypothetical protein